MLEIEYIKQRQNHCIYHFTYKINQVQRWAKSDINQGLDMKKIRFKISFSPFQQLLQTVFHHWEYSPRWRSPGMTIHLINFWINWRWSTVGKGDPPRGKSGPLKNPHICPTSLYIANTFEPFIQFEILSDVGCNNRSIIVIFSSNFIVRRVGVSNMFWKIINQMINYFIRLLFVKQSRLHRVC